MTAMRLKRYPSPSGGIALGKMGVGAKMLRHILPAGARWVEYLESTGTQWINTGLANIYSTDIVKGTLAVANDAAVTEIYPLFGMFDSPRFYRGVIRSEFGKSLYMNIVAGFLLGEITSALQEFRITDGNRSFGGVTKSDSSSFAGPWSHPFALFGYNNGGTGVPCAYPGVRFGSYSVEREGVKLIDLKPIAIGNTGYMLDLVSGEYQPFGNQGTGNFVIGPDINAPAI